MEAKSRRWLLATAAAMAATTTMAGVRKREAEAASGVMWYGSSNDADTSATSLYSTVAATGTVLKVQNRGGGDAIWANGGSGSSARGLIGSASSGRGVFGTTTTGDGVYGYADGAGDGVTGWANGSGRGVYGYSSAGIGVRAYSPDGTALRVEGAAQFNGVATFLQGMSGSGSGLTGLNASNLDTGTVSDTRLTSNIPRKNFANTFTEAITAPSFSGSLAASNLTGTIADGRLSTNVPLKNAASNTFTGAITAPSFSGSLAASNLTGTLADARLSANVPLLDAVSNVFAGDIKAAGLSGPGGGITGLDASNIESGVLPDGRLSANIPRKNAETTTFEGDIEAAHFVGDGSGLTNLPAPEITALDASTITSGTLADGRLSANVARKNNEGTTAFDGAISAASFTGPSGVPIFPTVGTATVRAGRRKVRVTSAAVSATVTVLAVLQSDPGKAVAIRHIAKGAGFFDIFLTGTVAAGTSVGYMVVGNA